MTIYQFTNATRQYPIQTVLLAGVISALLHLLVKANWHPAPAEPLISNKPQVIEVALVTPPPPLTPPKVEQPKPVIPAPKKLSKAKEKPILKPKPVAKPIPATARKTPPKITQKTFTQLTPDFKDDVNAKITAPVLAPPAPTPPVKTAPSATPTAKTSPTPATTGHGGQGNSASSSSGVVALHRTLPQYPSRAANRHIEGHVTVGFTIDPNGEVTSAKVISATPEDIFDDAAIAAIERWKFKPKIVNGVAVEQRAVQTLQFKLPN